DQWAIRRFHHILRVELYVKTDKLIMSCEAVSELRSQSPLKKEKFYRLEICVDNVASAKAASFAGL
ncbi:hypothetical protein TNCT_487121, partial [Trichonephila clavata]